MKKQFSMIAVLGILTMAACKKNNDDAVPPPQQEPVTQIASIKQIANNGAAYDLTKELIYDSEGRLKEIKYSGANSNMAGEKYTYSGNTVQYRHLTAGAEDAYASAGYTLNSQGRIQKKLMPYFNFTDLYEYNSAGFITRQTYLRNGSGDGYAIYHYSSSNVLDSISGFTSAGIKTIVSVFIYETGIKNSIGNENTGLKMLGKDQAAPVKSRQVFVYEAGSRRLTSATGYLYLFDTDGRITKAVAYQTDYPAGSQSVTYVKETLLYTYKQ
jgi:hypothetical protein